MKTIFTKLFFIIVFSIFSLTSLYAQTPQAINFQAIARDANGNPMANTNLCIRLSVIDSAAGGAISYQELRALQTNAHGSFSFQIGVNPDFTTDGNFQSIDWATGNKFLKIDYDPTNTFTFNLSLGTIKFATVPYAFVAESVVFIDATGAQNGDVLVYNSSSGKFEPLAVTGTNYTAGTGISIDGNTINNIGDLSDTNEIQILSLSDDTLSLSNGGGSVVLPVAPTYTAGSGITLDGNTINNIGDLSDTNEIQTLSLSDDTLSLSNGGGSVVLPAAPTYTAGSGITLDGNTINNIGDLSDTNEIQILSLSDDTLSLSNGGGSVILPAAPTYTAGSGITINENTIIANDISDTNEIQILSLSDDTLSLSNGGGFVKLPFELQTISISNDTIFLSNGGFVKLPLIIGGVLQAPTAITQDASLVGASEATLNGTINANKLVTTVVFEWGTTSAYGNTVTATQSPVTGTSDVAVSAKITGLQSATTYHFRIKAQNALDVVYGNDMSFTTRNSAPQLTTANIDSIKGTTAKSGGSITYDGGSPVTAQGLCWNTSPNPTTANSKTTSFTDVMTGLSPNTTYYVRAYATNAEGTGYGNEISFNSGKIIGSKYAGGLVFYNDGSGHGLVCAESDQSAGAQWGCSGTAIGGTSTEINTGAANTNAIVAGCTTDGIAAKICYDLVLNSYSDWYLPSKDELYLMYANLHTKGKGGFAAASYWSSSEYFEIYAWIVYFSNGYVYDYLKNYTLYVRAVRAF